MTIHTKAGALSPQLNQDALNSTFDPLGCYCVAEKCRAQDLRLSTPPGSDWLKHNELRSLFNSPPHPVRIWIWCYLMETHTGKLFLIHHSLWDLYVSFCASRVEPERFSPNIGVTLSSDFYYWFTPIYLFTLAGEQRGGDAESPETEGWEWCGTVRNTKSELFRLRIDHHVVIKTVDIALLCNFYLSVVSYYFSLIFPFKRHDSLIHWVPQMRLLGFELTPLCT